MNKTNRKVTKLYVTIIFPWVDGIVFFICDIVVILQDR